MSLYESNHRRNLHHLLLKNIEIYLPKNPEQHDIAQCLQNIINHCSMRKEVLHQFWPDSCGNEIGYYRALRSIAAKYNLQLDGLKAPNAKGQHDFTKFATGRRMPRNALQILIDLRGAQCESCGLTEWQGHPAREVLQIHHVDGDRSNNVLENLQLLCGTCHAMTDNFAAQNIGHASKSVTDDLLLDLIRQGLDVHTVLRKVGLRRTRRNYRRVITLYETEDVSLTGSSHSSSAAANRVHNEGLPQLIQRPTLLDLAMLVYNHTFDEVGQMFNHTGSWVTYILKSRGLPYQRKNINNYTLPEWEHLVQQTDAADELL